MDRLDGFEYNTHVQFESWMKKGAKVNTCSGPGIITYVGRNTKEVLYFRVKKDSDNIKGSEIHSAWAVKPIK